MNPELLIGEELTSVEFMADTLVLHFNENTLTLYAFPLVADSDGISLGLDEPGYRDALCFLIGLTIEKATYTEGNELTLEFDNSTVIALSLREEDLNTPEAGELTFAGTTYEF